MKRLLPLFLSFFVMGFVDIVGVSTSYAKDSFGLSDTLSNIMPMMVFVWFAICSLPVAVMIQKIGRKRTLLFSGIITTIAMLLPLVSYQFGTVLVALALLGIGNTILQVPLNPLLVSMVDGSHVTSMITLGQFIKAISSTVGPLAISLVLSLFGYWYYIFPLYALITFVSVVWLWLTPIPHESDMVSNGQPLSLLSILTLLGDTFLLQCFLCIVMIVGFEIGLMTVVPKYLVECTGISLSEAGWGCSIYFFARTMGTLVGSYIFSRVDAIRYLRYNLRIGIACLIAFAVSSQLFIMQVYLFAVGFMCANVFPIVFSQALQYKPERNNEISSLLIMGIAGGAILPLPMGVIADAYSLQLSLAVPVLALIYILWVASTKFSITKK